MDSASEKTSLLTRHEFFADMPASAINGFTAHARVRNYPAGTRIFAKGDDGHALFAVFSGLVRISVPSDRETELMLNIIGPNEVFGEISLLDGLPRTAHATAMTACRLLVLERRDFLATLLDEPAAALSLLKIVSGRLRRTSQRLEQASFGPMSAQLARALLSLEKLSESDGAARKTIRMAQRHIGNMVGLSRETTNRHLRAWHNAGLIAIERGGLTILQGKALARISEE